MFKSSYFTLSIYISTKYWIFKPTRILKTLTHTHTHTHFLCCQFSSAFFLVSVTRRLKLVDETYDCYDGCNNGFRKYMRTADHIFKLQCLIERSEYHCDFSRFFQTSVIIDGEIITHCLWAVNLDSICNNADRSQRHKVTSKNFAKQIGCLLTA